MRGFPVSSPDEKRGRRLRQRIPTLALCAVLLVAPAAVGARSARAATKVPSIDQVVVTNDRVSLLVFCRLGNIIPAEALQNTNALAPLQITYAIQVHRDRSLWPDQLIAETDVIQELTFDPLKESFQLKTAAPGTEEAVQRTPRIDELVPLLGTLNAFRILPLARLRPKARYYLTIKASLSSARDIFWRNHIFFFDRKSIFETPWYRTGMFGIIGSEVR
jgi:hypothetical protein